MTNITNLYRASVVKQNGVLHISSTSLQDFCTCPKRYYYNRIRKLVLKGGLANASYMFGIAGHRAMENYLLSGELPDFASIWKDFEKVPMRFTAQESDYYTLKEKGQLVTEAMVETLEMINAGQPYRYGRGYTVEVQDKYQVARNLVLTRTMDAILPIEGVPSVMDFKTAYRMYTSGLQDDVSDQLTAYSLPHSLKGVPQVEQAVFLVGTKTKTPSSAFFPVVRSERRQQLLLEDMKVIATLTGKGVFIHNRSPMNCGSADNPNCDYRELCYGPDEDEALRLYVKKA